jgi:hypothetical protein
MQSRFKKSEISRIKKEKLKGDIEKLENINTNKIKLKVAREKEQILSKDW